MLLKLFLSLILLSFESCELDLLLALLCESLYFFPLKLLSLLVLLQRLTFSLNLCELIQPLPLCLDFLTL